MRRATPILGSAHSVTPTLFQVARLRSRTAKRGPRGSRTLAFENVSTQNFNSRKG
jgi:hypothetical protein